MWLLSSPGRRYWTLHKPLAGAVLALHPQLARAPRALPQHLDVGPLVGQVDDRLGALLRQPAHRERRRREGRPGAGEARER